MELRVTIEGRPGSGKTTVARVVAGALDLLGFKVNLHDVDVCSQNQSKRVKALVASGTEVDIICIKPGEGAPGG